MGRIAVLASLVMLAGCPRLDDGGGECMLDRHCDSGEVCGRDGSCALASDVRGVTLRWTVNGAAPTTTSCAPFPDLFVSFMGSHPGDTLGYAPVPCETGQFFIDKLPDRFDTAELGVEGGRSSTKTITGATVMFDLR